MDPTAARAQVPEISLTAPDLLLVGETATASATVRDSAGLALPGANVVWSSSDPATVQVSSTGEITAVAPGRSVVTATSDRKIAQVAVNVVFARTTVDFGASAQSVSASGMINGVDPTDPPASRITPLRLRLWRGSGIENARRIASHATQIEFIVGAKWGDPQGGWPHGRPFENWSGYEEHVRRRAEATRGNRFIYEVWNEPDTFYGKHFWDGTDEQFFETYLRTFRVVRRVLGKDVLVAGPSITRFDLDYLTRFLDYCLANGCEVNVLTWHELGIVRPLSLIAEHIQTARRELLNNPKYARLKIREIHINEIIGPGEFLNPAANLLYKSYDEAGGADAAARACWFDSNGESTCWNRTLSGLLTPRTFQPRAVWWAAKYYAEGSRSRVPSRSTDARVVSLASRAAADPSTAQLLIGYTDVDGPPAPGVASLGVRLEHLDALPFARNAARVRVTVMQIPDSTAAPVQSLGTEFVRDVDVNHGTASFTIEHAQRNAVYVIALRAAPGS